MTAGSAVLKGDMGALRSHANNVRNESSIGSADQQIDLALGVLRNGGRGLSVDALTTVVGQVRTVVALFDGYVDQYADVVLDYANNVEGLQEEAKGLLRQQDGARESLEDLKQRLRALDLSDTSGTYPFGGLPGQISQVSNRLVRFESQVESLDAERSQLDRDLVSELETLSGQVDSLARDALGPDGSIGSLLPPTGGGGVGPHVAAVDGLFIASFMSPEGVAEWYEQLTEEEQNYLAAAYPSILGNLDGVPPGVRDVCNRAVLDLRIADLEKYLEELSTGRIAWDKGENRAYNDRVDTEKSLQELLDLRDQLTGWEGQPRNEGYPLFLLGFDPDAIHVQAIVAIGDVSQATHIDTHTPGMNTTVGGSQVTNALEILKEQNLLTSEELEANEVDGSVAGVFFLGYNAPNNIETATFSPNSGALPYAAQDGGRKLVSFSQGLRVTSKAPSLRSVLSAHSYGTEVGFHALSDPNHGFDAAVFSGSPGYPGTPVYLDEGDLFIAANDNDYVVHDLGSFGFHGHRINQLSNVEYLDVDEVTRTVGNEEETYSASSVHNYYGQLGDSVEWQSTSTDLNTSLVVAGLTQPYTMGPDGVSAASQLLPLSGRISQLPLKSIPFFQVIPTPLELWHGFLFRPAEVDFRGHP